MEELREFFKVDVNEVLNVIKEESEAHAKFLHEQDKLRQQALQAMDEFYINQTDIIKRIIKQSKEDAELGREILERHTPVEI